MDELYSSIAHYYRDILGLPDWETRTNRRLERGFEANILERLEVHEVTIAQKRFLDVGCGWGAMLYEMVQLRPACNIGIEPDPERARIARRYVDDKHGIVIKAVGEHLPFPSNFFDIVGCYEVLEHTRDPEATILEIVRVLKPGGIAHIMTPNYMTFYEPHYKLRWFPLIPKAIGRLYLRLRGRNPDFLEHIQYVNPILLAHYFKKHRIAYENLRLRSILIRIRGILGHAIFKQMFVLIKVVAQAYVSIRHREQEILLGKSITEVASYREHIQKD